MDPEKESSVASSKAVAVRVRLWPPGYTCVASAPDRSGHGSMIS